MIFDCFPFFNELDVLDIRLHELAGVVDRFVLAEAPLTHSGKPKPLHFQENRGRFSEFLGRIEHVVVTDFPPADHAVPGESWKYERHQRDALARGLSGLSDTDIVITSDVDEVPRADAVRAYDPSMGLAGLDQSLHAYWLNFVNRETEYAWSKILPYGLAKGMTHCQMRYTAGAVIKNGGWHFSFMGGVAEAVEKIEAWAHQEYNIGRIKDEANLRSLRESGTDPHGRALRYAAEALNGTYPRHVLENRARFRRLIKEGTPMVDAEARTVEWNLRLWDRDYAWPHDGDEWTDFARASGVPYGRWKDTLAGTFLYPYLARGKTVLELGAGHGRWSDLISPRLPSGALHLVEVSPKCAAFLSRKYSGKPWIEVHTNDGASLPTIKSSSVDLIWSFDTFVHIEGPEMRAYAGEFARVLKRSGMGVIHHPGAPTPDQRRNGCRSMVTSESFARAMGERGLYVIRQADSWEGGDVRMAGDAITVFARP